MKHHFINQNTAFEMEFITDDTDIKKKMNGVFYEMNGSSMLIKCDELAEYSKAQNLSGYSPLIHISFFQNAYNCEFVGRLKGVATIFNEEYTEIVPISGIETKSRRTAFRHMKSTAANIYEVIDKQCSNQPIAEGYTNDISTEAIAFFSNDEIKSNEGLMAEFTLFHDNLFQMPVKMLRKITPPVTSGYRYGYVFLYDLSEGREESNRLALTFFTNAVKSQQK